jgi:hypothetical protein
MVCQRGERGESPPTFSVTPFRRLRNLRREERAAVGATRRPFRLERWNNPTPGRVDCVARLFASQLKARGAPRDRCFAFLRRRGRGTLDCPTQSFPRFRLPRRPRCPVWAASEPASIALALPRHPVVDGADLMSALSNHASRQVARGVTHGRARNPEARLQALGDDVEVCHIGRRDSG